MARTDLSFTTVVVQSLSCVQLFATLWTAARQDSLFFTHLPDFAQTQGFPGGTRGEEHAIVLAEYN